VGSPLWMAPEVAKSTTYSMPGDIYSLGVLLYEIFERAIPYDPKLQKVAFPEQFASSMVVNKCIDPNATARPKAKDVLKYVDLSIKQTLAAVARVLPIQDQNTIVAQLDNLKTQRENGIRAGKVQMTEEEQKAAEVSEMLQTMYSHMLAKAPKDVDDLILKSATVAR